MAEQTDTELVREASEALWATTCVCKQSKPRGYAICGDCHFKLPREMRTPLHDVNHPDFPRRYREAVEELRRQGVIA
jgi:hypothetical protein